MTKHIVKSWSHFFDAIKAGNKRHDLRKMDRNFVVGDTLLLQRYDNINGVYTGEELEVEITYITSNATPCAFSSAVLDRNFCILSLKPLPTKIVIKADQFVVRDDHLNTNELFVPHKRSIGGSVKPGNYIVGDGYDNHFPLTPQVINDIDQRIMCNG